MRCTLSMLPSLFLGPILDKERPFLLVATTFSCFPDLALVCSFFYSCASKIMMSDFDISFAKKSKPFESKYNTKARIKGTCRLRVLKSALQNSTFWVLLRKISIHKLNRDNWILPAKLVEKVIKYCSVTGEYAVPVNAQNFYIPVGLTWA